MKSIDLIGHKYGRLLVASKCDTRHLGLITWDCICDCGNTKRLTGKALRSGATKSCGCLHIEHALKHVKANERLAGFQRVKKQNGRVEVKTTTGFVFLHRLLMEHEIGRKLHHNEVVHHKDHDKTNNDISNLVLMTASEHSTHHNIERGKTHGK